MKKISGSTFYFKKIFPTLWFGGLGLFFVNFLILGPSEESPIFLEGLFLAAPLVMAVFGYALFKKLVWDLADEVYDNGHELIFRTRSKEQRVNLQDIINIDYSHMGSPERVVVHTMSEDPIGKELVFTLPIRFNPFAKNPFVRELIERVHQARST
jgi:hypothetical protein